MRHAILIRLSLAAFLLPPPRADAAFMPLADADALSSLYLLTPLSIRWSPMTCYAATAML